MFTGKKKMHNTGIKNTLYQMDIIKSTEEKTWASKSPILLAFMFIATSSFAFGLFSGWLIWK